MSSLKITNYTYSEERNRIINCDIYYKKESKGAEVESRCGKETSCLKW